MKTTTILTALLFALLLIGCEKEEIEPMTMTVNDTVYIETPAEGITPFEYGLFFSDIYIIQDESNTRNISSHGTGNNRFEVSDTSLFLRVDSKKDYDPDNILKIWYNYEYQIKVNYHDKESGTVFGSIIHETDTGEFTYTDGQKLEIRLNTNFGIVELYLYN